MNGIAASRMAVPVSTYRIVGGREKRWNGQEREGQQSDQDDIVNRASGEIRSALLMDHYCAGAGQNPDRAL
jgi:hypothetical protein